MSEDRTQEPSQRRRVEARERGQVARSPELTGAAGLLAASALLGIWGDDLALALLGLVRESWSGDLLASSGPLEVVERLRGTAWGIAGPLLGILGGTVAASLLAHQAQVGGLFAPALIAPDPSRLWAFRLDDEESGSGSGFAARLGRGAWSVVKAAVVVGIAAWLIRSDLGGLHRLARLDPPALAAASGAMLRSMAFALALATLVLGLVDFALQYARFEAMMRLTPDQHREDLRAADGDPGLRSRRRKQAQALRGDAPELFAGASLAVLGASGLIIVLAGGPPPRRLTIRSSANGATGRRLRKSAEAAGVDRLEAPALALALARLRTPVVPPELMAALAPDWPSDS
jgi:flagellar biosynthetic protein FlhB